MLRFSKVRMKLHVRAWAMAFLVLLLVAVPAGADTGSSMGRTSRLSSSITLADGYIRIVAEGNRIVSWAVDPSGRARYQPGMILGMYPQGWYLVRHDVWKMVDKHSMALVPAAKGPGNAAAPFATLSLEGATLHVSFQAPSVNTAWILNMPWQIGGYVTNDSTVPFTRWVTDEGLVIPVQELKREIGPLPFAIDANHSVVMAGTHGFNLQFASAEGLGVSMGGVYNDPVDQFLQVQITPGGSGVYRRLDVSVKPQSPAIPADLPRFVTSDAFANRYLNSFYVDKAFDYPPSTVPAWDEWESLILDWIHSPLTGQVETGILNTPVQPDGYVDSWYNNPYWGGQTGSSIHYDTNAHYILGVYRTFVWTRDKRALRKVLPDLDRAMAFQLGPLKGSSGLLHITQNDHTGLPGGATDNYYDLLPFGGLDAYANVYFYASLQAMRQMEAALGNVTMARRYEQLAQTCKAAFIRVFWNPSAGRYIEDVSVKGQRVDYGATFVNLEAIGYGLSDESVRLRIYHWLDDEPIDSGDIHAANAYGVWHYTPMVTTIHNASWYTTGWTPPPFTQQLQDGGADLYLTFYDIMDRLATFGPNNAWTYLLRMLERFSLPDRLSGGAPLYDGETPQNASPGAIGVDVPFPESGLVPTSFLYGFLGIQATPSGLMICPNLPAALRYGGVENLYYRGHDLFIMERGRRVEVIMRARPFSSGNEKGVGLSVSLHSGQAMLLTGVASDHPVCQIVKSAARDAVMSPDN